MIEKEITFKTDVTLKGTVSFPNQETSHYPIVVMIHGSGPVDRNGDVKGMQMNAYRLLAEFFASIGVASLRYDKRGAGESGGDFYETGMWDLVNDGVAAVEAARKVPGIDQNRIFLVGHSEGCTLLPAIANTVHAAGLILLAGQVDNVRKASEMQIKLLEEEVVSLKGFQGFLLRALRVHETAAVKQSRLFDEILESDETVMKKGLTKINAKWMREHFQYNIDDDLAGVTCPVLAISGSKDIQVEPRHAYLFAEKTNGPSEANIINGMNHILRDQEEPVSILKLKSIYKNSFSKPLSPELLSDLKNWADKYMTAGVHV